MVTEATQKYWDRQFLGKVEQPSEAPVDLTLANGIKLTISEQQVGNVSTKISQEEDIRSLVKAFPEIDQNSKLSEGQKALLKAAIIRRAKVLDPQHELARRKIELTTKARKQLNKPTVTSFEKDGLLKQ